MQHETCVKHQSSDLGTKSTPKMVAAVSSCGSSGISYIRNHFCCSLSGAYNSLWLCQSNNSCTASHASSPSADQIVLCLDNYSHSFIWYHYRTLIPGRSCYIAPTHHGQGQVPSRVRLHGMVVGVESTTHTAIGASTWRTIDVHQRGTSCCHRQRPPLLWFRDVTVFQSVCRLREVS